MMLPPKAGRICNSRFLCSTLAFGSVTSLMSRSVQSAVSPDRIVEATRGARSRPMAVAPTMTICGRCFSISVAEHLGVGQRLVMGQPRMVGQIDVVDAVGDQLLGQRANARARQHRAGLDAQPVGQFAGLAAKLQRHVVQRAVFLFGEDPDFALAIRFDHSCN